MPEVVYAFATTGGSTPGASSWQKIRSFISDIKNYTSNTNKGTWQLRDNCIVYAWCVLQAQQHLVWGNPLFQVIFWGIGAHHGFQAHMGNQPTCPLEIGSPFVIKAGCALAFAAGIKTLFLWKCPNFWSNHFFGEMTSCDQTKAALCRLLCPNNDSTKSLGPKCRRVGWTNQAWISHIILYEPFINIVVDFDAEKPSNFFWKFDDEDLCMVDYFSGKGEAHQAFSQKLNFLNIDGGCCCSWFDLTHFFFTLYRHILRCKRTLPLFLSP